MTTYIELLEIGLTTVALLLNIVLLVLLVILAHAVWKDDKMGGF